jgi:hypothetical protein
MARKQRDSTKVVVIESLCADREFSNYLNEATKELSVTCTRPPTGRLSASPPIQTRTGSHVELTMSQLKTIFKHCKFDTIDSLRNPDAANIANQFLKNKKQESKRVQLKPDRKRERTVIYSYPEKLEPISARTHNSYIISLKAFCKWCCTTRPIPDCPLIYGLELARQTDKQTLRAATDDEMVGYYRRH